jgi:toxin ParE1/3/4
MRLSLSEDAEADLQEIARYSGSRWGRERARRYVRDLRTKLELLREHPELGPPADQIRAGLRRYSYVSHHIFYRIEPDAVRIVRILHKQMQVERRLD